MYEKRRKKKCRKVALPTTCFFFDFRHFFFRRFHSKPLLIGVEELSVANIELYISIMPFLVLSRRQI